MQQTVLGGLSQRYKANTNTTIKRECTLDLRSDTGSYTNTCEIFTTTQSDYIGKS